MKHTWKTGLAVAAVAMIGTAGAARADLTLDGQTGLFINPTAQVLKKGNGSVQADYQRISVDGSDPSPGGEGDDDDDGGPASSFYVVASPLSHLNAFGLVESIDPSVVVAPSPSPSSSSSHINTYGFGGAFGAADKLELSASYKRLSADGENGNEWRIGGKYQLLSQSEKGFDLAVGGSYGQLGGNLADSAFGGSLKHYTVYVAGTKAFNSGNNRAPIEGTLGLRWDRFSADDDNGSRASVYTGVAVPLSSDGAFSLVGELGSKITDGGKSPYAIGLRYRPKGTQFSIGAGFGRPGIINDAADKNSFFVRVNYDFGN